jgi:hypothetical protein
LSADFFSGLLDATPKPLVLRPTFSCNTTCKTLNDAPTGVTVKEKLSISFRDWLAVLRKPPELLSDTSSAASRAMSAQLRQTASA